MIRHVFLVNSFYCIPIGFITHHQLTEARTPAPTQHELLGSMALTAPTRIVSWVGAAQGRRPLLGEPRHEEARHLDELPIRGKPLPRSRQVPCGE